MNLKFFVITTSHKKQLESTFLQNHFPITWEAENPNNSPKFKPAPISTTKKKKKTL
jgi:hypothetical protein